MQAQDFQLEHYQHYFPKLKLEKNWGNSNSVQLRQMDFEVFQVWRQVSSLSYAFEIIKQNGFSWLRQ